MRACVKACTPFRLSVVDQRKMYVNALLSVMHRISFNLATGLLPLSQCMIKCWRGIVTVRAGGRAGGCKICGTYWRISSIQRSVELSGLVVVHCHSQLPISPLWACPCPQNLSNLPQIGSRLCGKHISETLGGFTPFKVSWTCLDL